MKKIIVILVFLITGFGADAAQRTSGTPARAARTNIPVQQNRSATVSRNATTQRAQTATANNSSARSATVVSRAAKQNVISTGTKVTTAAQNTVVDEKCWNGFMGCMDSFCMLDNVNGGRCMCSDKNAEYDSILAEIQSLDEQSYQMATFGVEQIEMGDAAKAVMDKTNSITKRIETDSAKSKRKSLDLSAWNINEVDFDADVEDIFSLSSDGTGIANKTGDALYRAAAKLCNAQLPECKSQSTMMELMYKQRVRSDCTAYENSLRQQRTQSAQKLATAQGAMREAALEQYRNANKYDLGQCTVQFKQCMQTTGGCGDDFSGCVGSIQEVTTGKLFDKIKQKKIKGTSSSISIAQSTYDILEAKKELCMTVTQQCVNVRSQVWDTFLREVAPQVKSAELMAESDMRTSCISNISQCFQKACKDNIDPNNPDGSYDMCLTNPSTVEDVCKIQVTPCKNSIPNIMEYVTARLASMRVDSCTREFKECLTSEDRCGKDYTQCVGLDTDTIVDMCPTDKLVACQYKDGAGGTTRDKDEVRENLEQIATGIFLNIDNNMLTACQRAADAAMIKVCGSTENCDDLAVDESAGTRSFKYQVCQFNGLGETLSGISSATTSTGMPIWTGQCYDSLDAIPNTQLQQEGQKGWAGKLSGLIYWGEIQYDVENNQFTTETDYMNALARLGYELNDDEKEIVHERVFGTEIRAMTRSVEQAISAIESDPTVQYCMTGREFQGMNKILGNKSKQNPRFPKLTEQMRRIIAASALRNARNNYMEKYDTEIQRMMKDQVKAAERLDETASKKLALEQAEQSCADWANNAVLPVSKAPKASNAGRWIAVGIIAAAAIVASIFTFGTAAAAGAVAISAIVAGTTVTASVTAGTVAAGVAVAAAATAAGLAATTQPVGKANVDQWNYKESVTTVFNYQTGECFKTKITQNCKKTKKNYCKEWAEEVEETTSINLLGDEK